MRAIDVMTSTVVSVTSNVAVMEVARLMLDRGVSAVPVVDADGKLIGMVSEGDLMRRKETGTERHHPWWLRAFTDTEDLAKEYIKSHAMKAKDVMTTNVVSVSETTPLSEIADLLEKHRIKRVPVVRDGRVIGIVSRANLVQALAIGRSVNVEPPSLDDHTIREKIMAELAGQPWGYLGTANVIVASGVVHLWGMVRSSEERDAIRVAAENIPGVRRVENHLSLRGSTLY